MNTATTRHYSSEAYLDAVKAVESSIQPVIAGDRGGLLWHHRLGHMAGHHRGTEASMTSTLFDYNHVDSTSKGSTHPRRVAGLSDAINAADASLSSEFLTSQVH